MTADKTINAIAGVVSMQLNDAAKVTGTKFVLQDLDLGLHRGAPELPIEIAPTSGATGVVFEPGRITDGIGVQQEVFGWLRVLDQIGQKLGQRERPRWFIPVDRS